MATIGRHAFKNDYCNSTILAWKYDHNTYTEAANLCPQEIIETCNLTFNTRDGREMDTLLFN